MGGMIEAIVFDKDGTLFDFEASWSGVMATLLDRLAPGDMAAAEVIGFNPDTRTFKPDSVAIAGTAHEMGLALGPIVRRAASDVAELVDEVAAEALMAPVVDLAPCLSELGRGRTLGLVTNDTEAPARAHLAAAGVTEFFDFVAGYDSGFGAKPDPGQLQAFARSTGARPSRTLMVGDSRADLLAGQRAGMRTIGVLTGVAEIAELSSLAEAVLPDIGHLASWIAGHRP